MPNTIILGAGIIGASTAYFLAHSPSRTPDHNITILDPCPPASGASGKSGGVFAPKWVGAAAASLAELSFRLHDELAREHDGAAKWGYRKCRALCVVGNNVQNIPTGYLTDLFGGRDLKQKDGNSESGWVKHGVIQGETLVEDNDSISHCDPYLLTTFLLNSAQSKGAEFIRASATGLIIENGKVKAVQARLAVGGTVALLCDNLVIATGPWTGPLSKLLLPTPIPITSYSGHSIIVRPSVPVSEDCLFMSLTVKNTSSGIKNTFCHPEVFPRKSGQVYICGINDTLSLPDNPEAAIPRSRDIEKLRDIASEVLGEYSIDKEQLCFRPMTSHGDPFVCLVPDVAGAYVGAGHGFWGITLGPGTGKVLSEIVLGEKLSADVGDLCLSNS